MLRRRAGSTGGERAQSTVELALLLPLVVLMLLTILQVALLARDVVLVTHASREAARAAATDPAPAAARSAAVRSSGLDDARLHVQVSRRGDTGTRVHVVVTYRAPTAVPIIGVLLGDRTIRSSATMRVEGPDRQVAANRP